MEWYDPADFIKEMIDANGGKAWEIFNISEEELDELTDEWWHDYLWQGYDWPDAFRWFCSNMRSWWEIAKEDNEEEEK